MQGNATSPKTRAFQKELKDLLDSFQLFGVLTVDSSQEDEKSRKAEWQEELASLRQEKQEWLIEKDRYRRVCLALRDLCIGDSLARVECFPMTDGKGVRRTMAVQSLFEERTRRTRRQAPLLLESPDHAKYAPVIADFVAKNGMHCQNPWLRVGVKSPWQKAQSLLQTFAITCHRIASLKGQQGLRCKVGLAAHTVLGQYLGYEYLESEFEAVFANSKEQWKHDAYAFEASFCDDEGSTHRLVIDAVSMAKECCLMKINDCREDISCPEPQRQDCVFWNVDFVTAFVNGWPCIFAVTKRYVPALQELLAFYGQSFKECCDGNSKLRHRLRNLIDSHILPFMDTTERFTLA